jgi:16S rRNA (cytosine967-C5)-methyltransferase
VNGKPALQKPALYTGGHVEVQDEGSQLLALLTGAKRGEMVVDFCAGAGGKTLALGAMMRNTGRLYAFDISGHRLDATSSHVWRAAACPTSTPHRLRMSATNASNVCAARLTVYWWMRLAQALGTLRRNPDIKWRQSPKAIAELNEKQAAILKSAARMVKPGGRLVYATCSLLKSENEVIAEKFSEAHPDFVQVNAKDKLEQGGCRPGRIAGDRGGPPQIVVPPPCHRRFLRRGMGEKACFRP